MTTSTANIVEGSTLPSVDLEAVRALATPVAEAHGVELYDVEWAGSPSGAVLRVFIQRPLEVDDVLSGVSLEDCVRVSRDLSTALDAADPIGPAYTLEVSSPGLNRPLLQPTHYQRQIGKLAKLKLVEPAADGQRVLRGTIEAVDGDTVRLLVDGNEHLVKLSNVRQAKLVFDPLQQKRPPPSQKKRKARGKS